MSTRYVWEKSDVTVRTTKTTATKYSYSMSGEERVHYVYQGTAYGEYGPLKKFYLTSGVNSAAVIDGEFFGLPVPPGEYVVPRPDPASPYNSDMLSTQYTSTSGDEFWGAKRVGKLIEITYCDYNESSDLITRSFYVNKQNYSKGNYISLASNSDRSAYNDNGVSGSNWYVYKGSDIIDPSAVFYSKTDIGAGDFVDIRITPRSPTYGGAVYYQYQVSTDGGNTWGNLGSKTTATSKTHYIEENTKQFLSRVLASDDLGFTSTTYVYGPNLPVSQIKAYATVIGKLRAGAKMNATVGGKIRQIQKGYATVGGKIRKMF